MLPMCSFLLKLLVEYYFCNKLLSTFTKSYNLLTIFGAIIAYCLHFFSQNSIKNLVFFFSKLTNNLQKKYNKILNKNIVF